MCFITLFILSCNNSKSDIKVNLVSNDLKGELSNYYKIVEGQYKFERGEKDILENYVYTIKVQVKRTETAFNFDAKDLESRGYFGITCDILDANKVPIITEIRNSENKSLTILKNGETGWAIFSFSASNKVEIEKMALIQLNSNVDRDRSMPVSSSTNAGNSSSADCDAFFKEYNEFVDSYLKAFKKYKANPTDPSVLSDYTDAAQKATEMQQKASECTDSKYASKYIALTQKLAEALQQ